MYDDEGIEKNEISEEAAEIMANHDLDEEEAERALELMDELGVDEDDAVDLAADGV